MTLIKYAPTPEVIKYAVENDMDYITAWSHLTAKIYGLKDEELPKFTELFKVEMNNQKTAEDSFKSAISVFILKPNESQVIPIRDELNDAIVQALCNKLQFILDNTELRQQDIDYINDDLDHIKIRYFHDVPDGDREHFILKRIKLKSLCRCC